MFSLFNIEQAKRSLQKLNATSKTALGRLAKSTSDTPDFIRLNVKAKEQPKSYTRESEKWNVEWSPVVFDHYHAVITFDEMDCNQRFQFLLDALGYINNLPDTETIEGMESFPIIEPEAMSFVR